MPAKRNRLTLPTGLILACALLVPAGPVTALQSHDEVLPSFADGPYVSPAEKGCFRSMSLDARGRANVIECESALVVVSGVDNIPAFSVPLRPSPVAASSLEPLSPNTPLLVLADTHGEYSILVTFLRAQGIIDADLAWTFGRGHLVVTGDMLDRGMHQLEILWLLYKLEAEAEAAGGFVHVLLGNHEAMVLRGDQRYLHPRYREIARRFGVATYSELLGPDTVLGDWLRSRPAVLKLGDLLLLHGGISPEVASGTLSLSEINGLVRSHLDTPFDHSFIEGSAEATIMGSSGPLWYRGYFPSREKPAAATGEQVSAALERFNVSHILVGHTIVESVRPLYEGKVIAVQVYPHRDEASGVPILEGALRIQGAWYRATAQGERVPLAIGGQTGRSAPVRQGG